MDSKLIAEYEDVLDQLATKFSFKTPLSKDMDYDDYYNEGYFFLLTLTPKAPDEKQYIIKSLKNYLENIHKQHAFCFRLTPYMMNLYYEFQNLKNQHLTDDAIVKQLNLKRDTYLLFLNLEATQNIENLEIEDEESLDVQKSIEKIYECINDTEKDLLNLYLKNCSLKEIAYIYNKTHEWARLKYIGLFNKIREAHKDDE